MTLGRKLFISYLLGGIIPALLIIYACYHMSVNVQEEILDSSLFSYMNSVDTMVELEKENLLMATRILAEDKETADAFREGDVPSLQSMADYMFSQAKRMDYLFIVNPDGGTVVKSLSPEAAKKGVDPQKFRTKTLGQLSISLRSNDAGDGIDMRASAPITDAEGTLLGTVLAGATLSNNAFVDAIKESFGIEFTIFRDDVRVATTLEQDGRRAVGTSLTNQVIKNAVMQDKTAYRGSTMLFGKKYFTSYWPITNEQGRVVGIFFLGLPTAAVDRANLRLLEVVLVIVVLTAAVLVVMSLLMTRSIVRPIGRAVHMLVGSSSQVAEASDNIASACQRLAGASADQSENLSRSAASLEELTGFAKQNADNTENASRLMDTTHTAAGEANHMMQDLERSMQAIRASSDQVAGVIKTIEDISFQTNLLALNAAVEAARAGEAGKGFAVVADEVRNLAQRAADAARSSTEIISQSVQQTRDAAHMATSSAASIESTLDAMNQVKEMLGQIGAASAEQSAGIAHLSESVNRLDDANREVVDNSSDAAQSAGELSEQSHQLEKVIGGLSDIIGAKPEMPKRPRRRLLGRKKRLALPAPVEE